MPEDVGERTEPATPRRRTEARDSGQVAKSQDLSAAVLLTAALITLYFFGAGIWNTLVRAARQALGGDGGTALDAALALSAATAVEVGKGIAPFFIMIVVVALVVLYAQVGWLVTFKPLQPKLDKLNPLNGLRRLFSPNTLFQLGLNLAKLLLVSFVAWLAIRTVINQLLLAHTVEFAATFAMACHLVFHVGIRLIIVLLLLAFIDYAYQRHRHEKQLRMTKQEVKEEMKRMEGDPVIKRRRREVQLRLAMERLKSTVPEADVVVTNPTHYAVALRYAAEEMIAPKMIAKGVDHMARRIRELAVAAGVPIVQKPELARRLYADVEVGREIPERFYRAVAEVLAYVYEISGRRSGGAAAGAG